MTQLSVAGVVPVWTLSDKLRKARETAGLSQTVLAEVTGMSRRTISAYETGDGRPRRPQLIAWAMATGVPLSWLEDTPSRPHGPAGGECPEQDSNLQPTDCEVVPLRGGYVSHRQRLSLIA